MSNMFKKRNPISGEVGIEWEVGFIGAMLILVSAVSAALSFIAAMITHVVVCIQTASWALLVIGSVIFPIGLIHGVMIWLGAA